MARAPSITVLSSAGLAGLQMSVTTRDMRVNSLPENNNAVLIAGPTASGKSALALELAQKTGGVIINTNSMQVYRDLRVITARPTPEEEALVPHRLYGHVDAAVNFSAGSLGRGCRERSCPKCARKTGCRSSSAARGFISRR